MLSAVFKTTTTGGGTTGGGAGACGVDSFRQEAAVNSNKARQIL
jgi:hypothetical protein